MASAKQKDAKRRLKDLRRRGATVPKSSGGPGSRKTKPDEKYARGRPSLSLQRQGRLAPGRIRGPQGGGVSGGTGMASRTSLAGGGADG
jgi:hypothetical protein